MAEPMATVEDQAPPREDVLRARDRLKVIRTRADGRWLRLLWLLSGPGVLVMLGENDGPSMLSYATTGALYGIGFFVPFILLTFLMAYVVQEMTVRLGAATHRGHAELIFQRFGPFWGYFAMADLVFGNLLTLVTEFIAIQAGGLIFRAAAGGVGRDGGGAGARLAGHAPLCHLGAHAAGCWPLGNLLFIPAALLAHPHPEAVLHALAFWGPLPGGFNTGFVMLMLANIGATVTPWMIFFQQSAVVDKGLTQGGCDAGAGWILRSARWWRRWLPLPRCWRQPRCMPRMSMPRNSTRDRPISQRRCGPISAMPGRPCLRWA